MSFLFISYVTDPFNKFNPNFKRAVNNVQTNGHCSANVKLIKIAKIVSYTSILSRMIGLFDLM